MKDKVVVHLIASMVDRMGPSEGILAHICAASETQPGYEHQVVSMYDPPAGFEMWDKLSAAGIKYHRLNADSIWDIRALYRLVVLLRSNEAVILHCHLYRANIYGRFASLFVHRLNNISTLRGVEDYMRCAGLKFWTARLIERLSAPLTDSYIAVSRGVLEAAVESLRIKREKVKVVLNAADTSLSLIDRSELRMHIRNRFGISDETVVVGSAASMDARKNPVFFVNVAKAVCEKCDNVYFLWAGAGPDEPTVKKIVKELRLEDRVRFIGFEKNIALFLSSLDIFSLFSRAEGLSRAMMEAMMIGLPCLVSNVSGVDDSIKNMETGIIVEQGDLEGAVKAIMRLSEDTSLRKKIGQRAKDVSTERFSPKRLASQYNSIYNDMLT